MFLLCFYLPPSCCCVTAEKQCSLKMFTTVFTKTKSSIFLLNLYQVCKKINTGGKKPNLEELKRENKHQQER